MEDPCGQVFYTGDLKEICPLPDKKHCLPSCLKFDAWHVTAWQTHFPDVMAYGYFSTPNTVHVQYQKGAIGSSVKKAAKTQTISTG
jgi:hypothetical protein